MECKSTITAGDTPVMGINRYIMECKSIRTTLLSCCTFELIDTLWNVNTYEPPAAGSTDKELIDTLWNVNMIGTLSPDMGHTN